MCTGLVQSGSPAFRAEFITVNMALPDGGTFFRSGPHVLKIVMIKQFTVSDMILGDADAVVVPMGIRISPGRQIV